MAAMALILVFALSLAAGWLAPAPYAEQFRDAIDARPSWRFPLGTDELGRDRLSRLLYGTRLSLCLAPAAALVCTLISALVGLAAGLASWVGRVFEAAMDLVLSLPWLFLLLTVRALLPLNVSPLASVLITFALLALLGWAAAARVVYSGVCSMRDSDFMLLARAQGSPRLSRLLVHLLPNLKPLLRAQFVILVPVFLIAEANLGMLGLGVSEPLPSWGNLLRGLENAGSIAARPWTLAPAVLLVLVVSCFHLLVSEKENI
jgi:ABC-type dipeptide/oligopeptide/nickel transport system permease subunit